MISIDATPINQAIAASITAGLYVVTYLSFVHLLKYPRNWRPPSLSTSLSTAALAILTISLVSLTTEGIDVPALVAAAVFITVLFYIMAAPAIAFRPASKQIEFFAKHGDYAGLCFAVIALLAGLTIPNIKLQAVLAVACIIELSWFLRLRWADRGRQVYALNDIDLSVLKTQAKGDLAEFRRRHGIRELMLTPTSVSWKGCSKNTSPCPFNLYVNRLGLNTTPCCREHMKDLSYHVAAGLDKIGVVYWLEGGSLLGAVRENGALLDWEDDVDISVLLDDTMSWDRLATGLAEHGAREGFYVDLFNKSGFISVSFDQPKPWPFRWERNRLRGEIRADIAIYRKAYSFGKKVLERRTHKGNLPRTESGGYGVPEETILPTSTLTFVGGEFSCPHQPETYLQLMYGDFNKIEYTYLDAEAAKTRTDIDTVRTVCPDDAQ
jgi:hypothetical protein